MQDDPSLLGGPERPLAFFSARLSDAERNYPVGEQELLAVVSALKKWRCYLEGAKGGVTVVTDHLPNTFLDKKSAEQFSRRQVRWQLELSRISPSWVYEKGQTNAADPLSRCPTLLHASAPRAHARAHESAIKPVMGHHLSMCDSGLHSHPLGTASYGAADGAVLMTAVADASRSQEPDAIEGIVQAIADWYKDNNIEQSMRQTRSFTLRDGLWRYGELIVVPEDESLRSRCIAINHEIPSAGHSGRDITLDLVQRHFWWPTIRQDVVKHVASCVSCNI